MRKWIALLLGAWICGGGIMHDIAALLPLGAGVALFGYIWFSFGMRLVRLANGEEMGCLHLSRELGYDSGESCSRCDRRVGYEIERWIAVGAWFGMALCGAGAFAAVALRYMG